MGAGCSTLACCNTVKPHDVTLTVVSEGTDAVIKDVAHTVSEGTDAVKKQMARAQDRLYDFPKALAAVVSPEKCPPNPSDGPTVTVHNAVGMKEGWAQWPWLVALCVTMEGDRPEEGFVAKTAAVRDSHLQWAEGLHLGAASATKWTMKTKLTLYLCQDRGITYAVVGQASITLKDLIGEPRVALLIEHADGNPVLSGTPYVPCEISITLEHAERPDTWPLPPKRPGAGEGGSEQAGARFPKHIFMMTRGTRGDVQPFVALARGICNSHGWLVTICTEASFRDFVLSKCADVTRGEVRFLCSGGDTTRQTETWLAQALVNTQSEAIQAIMMAAAESNFFNSAPVMVHQLRTFQGPEATLQPVDLIVNSFTLTGVALLCGEVHQIPVAGFCLQPSSIPSADKEWKSVIPIESHGISLLNSLESSLFTTHTTLGPMRALMEENPFANLSLPNLRAR